MLLCRFFFRILHSKSYKIFIAMYVTFSDLSNKDKVMFLSIVLDYYLSQVSESEFIGLCIAVYCVMIRRFHTMCKVSDFMGVNIWNYKFAGVNQLDNNLNGYWWPLTDVDSRIQFINKLIRLYNV